MNPVNHWIDRGDKWVYLEGIYWTSASHLVSLDWEQPTVEDLEIQEGINGIACLCGRFPGAFGTSRVRHPVWVLLQCGVYERCWYCCSSKRQGICPKCGLRFPNQADVEPKILKFVCGKSHLVTITWGCVWEENWDRTVRLCEERFGWKPDRTRRRR